MKEMKEEVIYLCGVQGCCPEVSIKGDEAVLRDDAGGQITLTREQLSDLVRKALDLGIGS